MFTLGTVLNGVESVQQLFQCCDCELGDEILQSYPNAVTSTEHALLTELLSIKQDHAETTRSFLVKLLHVHIQSTALVKCVPKRLISQM